jgi:hypothetical protein
MKKSLIYFVVLLFVIQLALADITVDSLDREEYNFGDRVNVKGVVLFNEEIQGAMRVNLKCDSQSIPVYFTLLDLGAGEVHEYNLDIPTRDSLEGDCNFIVSVEGIAENFEKTSEAFTITGELDVDVSVDKILAQPGDSVVIIGNAKRVNGDVLEESGATLLVDGDSELVNLEEGVFEYTIQLSPSVDSGNHLIEFIVEDSDGNSGTDDTSFKVSAVPTSINLAMGTSYAPGESIKGKAILYDQAGVLMEGDGSVEVYNSVGEIEYSQNIKSNEAFEFVLNSFSIPGTWRTNVAFETIETNKNVNIEEVKEIQTWLEEGVFFAKNIGNVDYNEPIEITLEGADSASNLVKETSLKPNQTIQFDLGEEVKYSGEYEITSPTGITGNVVLEGRKNLGSTFIGWVAVGFVFVFFIYMVVKKGKSLKIFSKKGTDVKEVREKGKHILERTHTEEDKIKQEDIDHLVSKVKESNPQGDKKESKPEDKSMFKIFD